MAFRAAVRPLRRLLSSTPTAASSAPAAGNASQKLPFEKPLFESEILDKAHKARRFNESLQFWCDAAYVVVAASLFAKLGYYAVYGKHGGAAALPRRRETSSDSS